MKTTSGVIFSGGVGKTVERYHAAPPTAASASNNNPRRCPDIIVSFNNSEVSASRSCRVVILPQERQCERRRSRVSQARRRVPRRADETGLFGLNPNEAEAKSR